jgi:hypothetical protein
MKIEVPALHQFSKSPRDEKGVTTQAGLPACVLVYSGC